VIYRPCLIENLQFDVVDDGYIVRMSGSDWVHYLNPTAMLIALQCDGSNTPEQIARFVQELHGLATPPTQEVEDVLAQLHAEAVLRDSVEAPLDEVTEVPSEFATQRGETAHA
jgi:hypothetical protein